MAKSIHVRLDEPSESALSLLRAGGDSESEAVRRALQEAAAHRRSRASLQAEAQALAADPSDRAEAALVRAELDALRPAPVE
jgi:Arc/MetJ-type ribon-helix-helix transcriptional regulator